MIHCYMMYTSQYGTYSHDYNDIGIVKFEQLPEVRGKKGDFLYKLPFEVASPQFTQSNYTYLHLPYTNVNNMNNRI